MNPQGRQNIVQQDDLILELKASESESRFLSKRWLVFFLFFVSIGAVYFLFLQKTAPQKNIFYKTALVERGKLAVVVTATGTLQPINEVDVGTEVSGTVRHIYADYNGRVEKGQVLAVLDTSSLNAQVKQSEALLASAKAGLLQVKADVLEAKKNLSRMHHLQKLSSGELPSSQELDVAEIALQRAEAEEAQSLAAIDEAAAKLSMDQTNLEKATIFSPITGIVLERSVEVGQTVAASLESPVLFTLAEDLRKMELQVNVDEADIGKLQETQQASFTVDAYPKRTFPSIVKQVRFGAQEDEGVVTYITILEVDNSDFPLRPGMTATADIVVKQVEDAVMVPNAALRFTPKKMGSKGAPPAKRSLLSKIMPGPPRPPSQQMKKLSPTNGQSAVWILQDGRPMQVPVRTGISNDSMTEIVEGDLDEGDRLITEEQNGEQ